ncbi:hypothetical protein [Pseudacidovorax intermedius]|uniref:Uncharacterized protein n=1 Tax=Pseudacidovorax intermedius TaxID=433924 RepID=A0A147GPC0_9BURK|nr:hypothetical protein [Pseudacidovorax intermedius]KTT15842.1 hypothetical protein NS331_19475 [Pseudacidovorax intermedius]
MSSLEDQAELPLARKPNPVRFPAELVRSKKTAAAAFTLACDASGLEDKEIYLALGIDAGYFSNIKKGKATLQADKVKDFCQLVENTIYVEWHAYQVGHALVLLKSEAERRAEVEKKRADDAEMKLRVLMEALAGRMAS